MGKTLRILIVIVLAVMMAATAVGCGEPEPAETPNEPEYAGAIAESLLQALINTENYTAFSEHFDETMRKNITEASFKQTHDDLSDKYGEYISKKFTLTEENVEEIYTAVSYNATFSKRTEGITVKVIFQETAAKVYVSGIWFQ